jgi:hypothetical protein
MPARTWFITGASRGFGRQWARLTPAGNRTETWRHCLAWLSVHVGGLSATGATAALRPYDLIVAASITAASGPTSELLFEAVG